MMSAAATSESDIMMFCASCGTAEDDDIKLKKCACHLVKYCSVKCQKDHRPKHKKECKKRTAELRDEILFKQPEESHLGDCPICCVPLPIDVSKSGFYLCCSKHVCDGCDRANKKRQDERRLQHTCPFCREALSRTQDESKERLLKRIQANDPVAMRNMGTNRDIEGDHNAAFDYWTKAAALGDVVAHFQLSNYYYHGKGVEKDEKRALYHTEQAAIGGHPHARYNLGYLDMKNDQVDRAKKHWIIAAKLGHDQSLTAVKDLYRDGLVSKEDFATALRGHKAAIDATTSPQRKEAAAFYKDHPKKEFQNSLR